MTTFFAGESEVKIVDPSRIHAVKPFGGVRSAYCSAERDRCRRNS
jgi:hypothetical protein